MNITKRVTTNRMTDDDSYSDIDADQVIVDQQTLSDDEIRGFVQDFGTDKQEKTYQMLNGSTGQSIDWEAELIVYEPSDTNGEIKYRLDIGQKGKQGSLPSLEGTIDTDTLDGKQEHQYRQMEQNHGYVM